MPLTPLPHIKAAGIIGAPIQYRWDRAIGLKLYADKDQNPRLYTAVDKVDFRAKMGIGMAITEWVVWRLSAQTDVTDALLRVEAGWATLARPHLAPKLRYKLTADHEADPVLRPLEQAFTNLGALAHRYATGDIYLAEIIVRQATLARHIAPSPPAYDQWLSELLRTAAAARPRGDEYDEDDEVFDYAHEAPVARDAFGSIFDPALASAAHQDAFLQTLDTAANPYLEH
jgi:hypothetical protein